MPIKLLPELTLGTLLQIACFDKHLYKKARFSKKWNLASEEGDEKLFVHS